MEIIDNVIHKFEIKAILIITKTKKIQFLNLFFTSMVLREIVGNLLIIKKAIRIELIKLR